MPSTAELEPRGLLMGGRGAGPTQSKSPKSTRALGALGPGAGPEAEVRSPGGGQKPGVLKTGCEPPRTPPSAGPRGPSQGCPVSTKPGSTASPCTGEGRGGRVRACVLRGRGQRRAPGGAAPGRPAGCPSAQEDKDSPRTRPEPAPAARVGLSPCVR